MSIRVVANELKPAEGDEDFRLHLAALEWSLAEPIIINSADDIKSSVDWKDRVDPFHHQVQNLMRFCRRLPVTLLADDVGLGKTISAGLIIAELMKRNRVSKVFVICPKILIPQWIEELGSKFGISAYGAVGTQLRAAHNRTESVIVTTYQSATGFLQRPETSGRFDMLILDEAHKVRNLHGTPNPPQMATAVFKALESRMFKYVVMLTATPIQNRLWDIYSLVDCLAVARGHKNPFGTPEQFGSRFIADSVNTARRLNANHAEEFRKIVNSYMFRTRRVDAQLTFPDRQVQTAPVNPSTGEQHLQRVIAENISGFNALQQTSLLVALMSSPHALAMQLNNMASNGTAEQWLADEVSSTVRQVSAPAKASMVLRVAKDLKSKRSDWRMVIFTTRKETQRMLGEVLGKAGIACGYISGGEPAKNNATILSFREDNPKINVIISTDAGAEGVNLQAANVLVNYDLPWNPMIVEQRIGRVQRIGSRFKNVWVVNIVHNNSPEQRIVGRLMEKLQVISHTVGDIEAVLEATNDSNGDTLEKQIREMVVASLKGQDQEQAARAAEKSIEEARKLIEKNQEEMDRQLGSASDSEDAEIPMPRLKPALPSMPLEDFVIGALRSEGATVSKANDGLYSCRSDTHGDNDFTFDDKVLERFSQRGVFMGRAPHLYQQGKPAFERLVQRWIDRSAARIQDKRCSSGDIQIIAGNWIATVPSATLTTTQVSERHERFAGSIVCRTRVANAVDSYEKLIELNYKSNGRPPHSNTDLTRTIQAKSLVPDLDSFVSDQVDVDSDIGKFRDFYESRLKIELQRSDSGDRKAKLVNDLGPGVTADASALRGELTDAFTITVNYQFGGEMQYQSVIKVERGKVIREPQRDRCTATNSQLPVDCLELCKATGRLFLRERLGKSEVSGEYAVPDAFVVCEESGRKVHQNETATCCITGKLVCRSFLIRSELSGRFALPMHTTSCEITGATVICDELVASNISKKRFRSDQAVKLANDTIAHSSEATQCFYSQSWLASDQCDISDVSNRPVSKERLAYSEHSNRKCDISELVTCDKSGTRLLPDEVGQCEMSKKRFRKDLLRRCPETGKTVEQSLLVPCEETGVCVLADALDTCCISGKRVRKSLLGKSDASGKKCLADRLVQCEISMARLLPEETNVCQVTRSRADVRLLKKCGVSGKIALSDKMVQSKASGKWMLTEYTKTLPSGVIVGEKEVAICCWTRKYLRVEQTAVCALCGLVFEKSLMNASGEFSVLRECLDGKHRGHTFPEPGFLARIQPKIFAGIIMFQWVTSTSKKAHVMFGKKSTFGFNSRVFAVVAEGDLTGLQLRGKVLFGKRSKRIWHMTESHELTR